MGGEVSVKALISSEEGPGNEGASGSDHHVEDMASVLSFSWRES